jgi:hypothetical protein
MVVSKDFSSQITHNNIMETALFKMNLKAHISASDSKVCSPTLDAVISGKSSIATVLPDPIVVVKLNILKF